MTSPPDRQAALAAALRANLRRRKLAARPADDARPGPPAEAGAEAKPPPRA